MAITALGKGLMYAVLSGDRVMPDAARWLVCGSAAVIFVSIALIGGSLQRGCSGVWFLRISTGLKLTMGGVALGLAWLGEGLGTLTVLALLVPLLLVQIVYAVSRWVEHQKSRQAAEQNGDTQAAI